jgi:hypothetical protein
MMEFSSVVEKKYSNIEFARQVVEKMSAHAILKFSRFQDVALGEHQFALRGTSLL